LGFEKSQRSVTHDSLRYINILTYLLTYLLISNVVYSYVVGEYAHSSGRIMRLESKAENN